MFREMRRKKQELTGEEIDRILHSNTSGVLAVSGDDDYPYSVPLSYTYNDGKLYFHCAKEGHKLDGIKRNDKVSFCVIDQDKVIPKDLTTHYRSVIIFGRARILTGDDERRSALEKLGAKYSADYEEDTQKAITTEWERVCLVEIEIEHVTGKAAIELI
jgi:hypothetical protein